MVYTAEYTNEGSEWDIAPSTSVIEVKRIGASKQIMQPVDMPAGPGTACLTELDAAHDRDGSGY